jgi:LuxR family transcriptional regulator, quorum-sensing system regulator SolR
MNEYPSTLKILCDAYEAMQQAKTSEELRGLMERFTKQLGFEHFVYVLSISAPSLKPQQVIVNGFPRQWLDRYLAGSYFKIDPLVKHTQSSSLPAIWQDQVFHDRKSEEFWEEAKSFGLNTGLSLSMRDHPGMTGIFSLARDRPIATKSGELAELIGRAQMFAFLVHEAVARIELPKVLPEQNVVLTARERECLLWAANGKTAWEISQILGIAERTAVFHVNNVIQKLGAANRTQAIVRAVSLKLL